MALKIVQPVGILTTNVSTAATTRAISLKSGYIRVSTGYTGAFIEIGTNPQVTRDSFYIPPYSSEVIKETLKRSSIVGITTGTSTLISFGQNLYHSFEPGEYVSIENASPAGINTTHVQVLSVNDSSLYVDYDSSSVTNVSISGTTTLVKSIKVAALGHVSGGEISITEVVQLVTE